ncbi:hypothetical protein [Rhizobium sp. BK376]|uniref:hypothetical protein n=1 Tax=Rhizobium sp. BK376 TaxID=2512149 RepID=UPI001FE09040|nr:hypothetical protein [Rhizobium sp. BK376]
MPTPEMGDAEQAQDGSEVYSGLETLRIPIQPASQAHRPTLYRAPCESSCQVGMVGGVAAVTQRHQV